MRSKVDMFWAATLVLVRVLRHCFLLATVNLMVNEEVEGVVVVRLTSKRMVV